MAKTTCLPYETLLCSKRLRTSQHSLILMNHLVRDVYLSLLVDGIAYRCIVLHTIRNRYAQHSIYTYSGIVLIAMNPFQRVTLYGPEIIQAYSGKRRGELEPHLFAIAEDAYTAMRKDGMGQTIIVSGERCVFHHEAYGLSTKLFLQWCRENRIGMPCGGMRLMI
jgi:hypothetical protein